MVRMKAFVPSMDSFKLVWTRLTATRMTIFYALLALAHCIIQVAFQVMAFQVNSQAATLMHTIMRQGNVSGTEYAHLDDGDGPLRICYGVQMRMTTSLDGCPIAWSGNNSRASMEGYGGATPSIVSFSVTPTPTTSQPELRQELTQPTTLTVTEDEPESTAASSTRTVTRTVNAAAERQTLTSTRVVFVTESPTATPRTIKKRDIEFHPVNGGESVDPAYDSSGEIIGVHIRGLLSEAGVNHNHSNDSNGVVFASATCVRSLTWPAQILRSTKREDVTFIAFQIWVLGMSIVALLNESMPHIIAALLTHVLATAWSGFQIAHTAQFRSNFLRLTRDGACQGINLLPDYWAKRGAAEIAVVSLNVAALLASAFLSWRLLKSFGWATFKRVGASLIINRVYKLVLVFSILIQLSLFFIVASMALWIDELYNGPIGRWATRGTLYKALYVVIFVLLVPWLTLGWFAVRREQKIRMYAFVFLSAAFVAGWGAMFHSVTYRLTFMEWRFFSVMSVAAAFLTFATAFLGVVCLFNFGKGLTRYLQSQQPLDGDDFVPVNEKNGSTPEVDIEKVPFPNNNGTVPSFSVAFGAGVDVPPPSKMRFGPNSAYGLGAVPEDSSAGQAGDNSNVRRPPIAGHARGLSRTASTASSRSYASTINFDVDRFQLERSASNVSRESQRSYSNSSAGSHSTHGSRHHERKASNTSYGTTSTSRRWIIE